MILVINFFERMLTIRLVGRNHLQIHQFVLYFLDQISK
ncbi:hypothetical protein SAMN05192561_10769 [Halopenitus malekzadehii]|uniref:Uncharacterized protein n=1 Tax=Halopenitus malekzadehii TaxID=1267564 RepID=A0A1H6JC12_9EURY|nr:hypothetical protein SAMN05192561_10769 [Halopenitus malekzadehii]